MPLYLEHYCSLVFLPDFPSENLLIATSPVKDAAMCRSIGRTAEAGGPSMLPPVGLEQPSIGKPYGATSVKSFSLA